VGCELLQRSTHNVELTLAGEALLASARQLLAGLDEAVTAARPSARTERPDGPTLGAGPGHARPVTPTSTISEPSTRRCVRNCRSRRGEIHPVNAGAVAGLALTPPAADGTTILYAHGGAWRSDQHTDTCLAAALLWPRARQPSCPTTGSRPSILTRQRRGYRAGLPMAAGARPPRSRSSWRRLDGRMLLMSVLPRLKHQGTPQPGAWCCCVPVRILRRGRSEPRRPGDGGGASSLAGRLPPWPSAR